MLARQNNVVEQDHRAIKRWGRASQHFRSFWGAWCTIAGYEAIHMIRKGQARQSAPDGIAVLLHRFILGVLPLQPYEKPRTLLLESPARYNSFHEEIGARKPAALCRRLAFFLTWLRIPFHDERELLSVLRSPFRVRTPYIARDSISSATKLVSFSVSRNQTCSAVRSSCSGVTAMCSENCCKWSPILPGLQRCRRQPRPSRGACRVATCASSDLHHSRVEQSNRTSPAYTAN
jgi:hypothetical protein